MCAAVVLCPTTGFGAGVEWKAPQTCPSQQRLESEITRLIGKPVVAVASLSFAVTVTPAFEVGIFTSASSGETSQRSFIAHTCDDALRAAALIIALTIDPSAVSRARKAGRIKPIRAEGIDNIIGSQGVQTSLSFGAHALFAAGLLPEPSAGVGVSAELAVGLVRFELGGRAFLPSEALLSPAAGVRVGLVAGSLLLCTQALSGLALCAGGEAGVVTASGFGVPEARSQSVRWTSAEIGARVQWQAQAPFGLRAGASVVIPIDRPQFGFAGAEDLFQSAQATLRAHISFVWGPLFVTK